MAEQIEVAIAGKQPLKTTWRAYSDYEDFYFKRIKLQEKIAADKNKRIFRFKFAVALILILFLSSAFLVFGPIQFTGKVTAGAGDFLLSISESNSSSFSVGRFHIGLSGGNESSKSLTSRNTLTYQQGGSLNASSLSYSANAGWFAQPNSAPVIESVSITSPVSPLEGSARMVNFSFVAFDSDGFGDLSLDSGIANFTKSGEAVRAGTCSNLTNIDANRMNFSCSVDIWYFDAPGIWNVTVQVSDSLGFTAGNSSAYFSYDSLTAMVLYPSAISFGSLNSSSNNVTASNFSLINNTGNVNLTTVKVKAFDVLGDLDSSSLLHAENFTASVLTGGSPPAECSGNSLLNNTGVNITNATVPRGNFSAGLANEQIYYCIPRVPLLKRQTYSTRAPWLIEVTSALAVFSFSRKRKKKVGKLIAELDAELMDRYGVGLDQVNELLKKKEKETREEEEEKAETAVPVSIFASEGLSPTEALVSYLKDECGMKFSEIAAHLLRDDRTVWSEYHLASKKEARLRISKDSTAVPLSAFRDSRLSAFETVVKYLRARGLSNVEVSRMMNKDPRNVYTVYSRAIRKAK